MKLKHSPYLLALGLLVAAIAFSASPKNPIVQQSLTSCLLKVATVTLTDAQIKNLPTSAVELVAALGAGKMIVPVSCLLVFNVQHGQYFTTGEQSLILMQGGSYVSSPLVTSPALTGLQRSYGYLITPAPALGNNSFAGDIASFIVGSVSAADNASIMLKDDYAGVANYTGGHPDNTLKVTVWYVEVDL